MATYESERPGTLLVEMEKPGQDSRWSGLRALRVFRGAPAGL